MISRARLDRHLQQLVSFGPRLTGTPAEDAAADYIAAEFAAAGAAVTTEPFPVQALVVDTFSLQIRLSSGWRSFPGSLFSSTPGTSGVPIEAPLVIFEAPSSDPADDLSWLRGKAVLHLGTHIESRAAYQRLIAAEPAFILMVDIRFPGERPLADGMFPAYTRDIGAVPTVNVAFQDAWQWCVDGADAARLCVSGGMTPSESRNIIAEFPGDGDDGAILFCGAHHDTQADSVGADDNATAVAGVLELARVLGETPRRRTLRLISFGAEEQLSVGSAAYVRRHWGELQSRGGFMFNLDSFGSHLGWFELWYCAEAALLSFLRPHFRAVGATFLPVAEPVPYADHFPFAAAGLPALTLSRNNCTAGRFFHHRPDDDLSRVSTAVMGAALTVAGSAVSALDSLAELPFGGCGDAHLAAVIARHWQDLFGG